MTGRYTYGDTELAASRLERVAAMFEPTSSAFMTEAAHEPPALAVDLGCGPGFTTRLLHRVTGAARTVGLDRSGLFLDRARVDAPDHVTFDEHDVRLVPFPTGPADLISCRLLLAHLPEPVRVVSNWATQLRPDGLLLLDEPELVDTDEPIFVKYLDQVARSVIAREGAELYVGPALHAMPDPPGTERTVDRIVAFTPDVSVTATVFAMNLEVLVRRGEIAPRPDLAEPLEAVVAGASAPAPTWHVRQIALRSVAQAKVRSAPRRDYHRNPTGPGVGIGRRRRLKSACPKGRVGSSPTPGTEGIEGRAFETALSSFVLDPEDLLGTGFLLR